MSLCTIVFMHSLFPQQITEKQADLDVKLLGIRDDMIDLTYIQDLLAQGATITARDAAKNTALMKFAKRSYYPECRLLITHSQFYVRTESHKELLLRVTGCLPTGHYSTYMSLSRIRNHIHMDIVNEEEIIQALTKYKIEQLKPLLREALSVTDDQDREIKELLDPEKLEQNFSDEIRERIKKDLRPDSSGFFSCGIQ